MELFLDEGNPSLWLKKLKNSVSYALFDLMLILKKVMKYNRGNTKAGIDSW